MTANKYSTPWDLTVTSDDTIGDKIIQVHGICENLMLPEIAVGSVHDAELEIMERIVACVNACAGINPEAVPEMISALRFYEMGQSAGQEASAALKLAESAGGGCDMTWRPIETAPRDGSEVLLCFGNMPHKVRCVGSWRQAPWMHLRPSDDGLSKWRSESGRYVNPSHWMPLPAMPEEP